VSLGEATRPRVAESGLDCREGDDATKERWWFAVVTIRTDDWLVQVRQQLLTADSEDSARLLDRYAAAFPTAFVDSHPASWVPEFVAALEGFASREVPQLRLVGGPPNPDASLAEQVRLALLWSSPAPALLADVFPVLENLGLRVSTHSGFEVSPADRPRVRVEEFTLAPRNSTALLDEGVRDLVTAAYDAVWSGAAEDDGFNQLVIRAGLSWREVMLLRAVSAYLRQAGTVFTPAFAVRTLLAHRRITRLLVELFAARFDPTQNKPAREELTLTRVEEEMATIDNLTEDRLLRAYVTVLTGTVRTNFFQSDGEGHAKPHLVLKLEPSAFAFLPQPRPEVETLVYAPRVEGLHLRSSRVARGGIRWSDRSEDYRTEVLGLMKAQRVKNAVIVPHGAKGAFVIKRPPAGADAQTLAEEVRDCYATFVCGLLDVTDNLVEGEVVSPPSTVCHDGPDAYLVVAADKGTATFSDLANGIAAEYRFWLGDAFASGGSAGYDHKALGVTARGAWESLRRHLGELGMDPARGPLTVAGIGDMSGDVFGNAMLLSEGIRLVAAFDHRHVFLDPDPDMGASYGERTRLFGLPSSSWADYREDVISDGGGVFPRTAASIPLSPEARALLRLSDVRLSGEELVRAVLRAPVDVLFNGGIGTYVKASTESQAEAGDRSNDGVRVDATALRARVVVEGGNLGLTQRARIEYALAGGRINTDFIDNSAGVETSDREVNLKILLNEAIRKGRVPPERRDILLRHAAEQVVAQVLANNASQALSISASEWLGPLVLDQLVREIRYGEEHGILDRRLEFMPDEETLARRRAEGIGLTRPEIGFLLAMSKNSYSSRLLDSEVPDDPAVWVDAAARYLPSSLSDFGDLLLTHPLRREIAVSTLVNEMFNRLGSGVMLRVMQLTGQKEPTLVLGYLASRGVLGLPAVWAEIDRLDVSRAADAQTQMLVETRLVVERASRWFLRHRDVVDPAAEIARLRPGVEALTDSLPDVLPASTHAKLERRIARLVDAGAPPALARKVSVLRRLSTALDLVEAAYEVDADLPWFAEVYFGVGEELETDWIASHAYFQTSDSHWLLLAKTSLVDELWTLQRQVAVAVLDGVGPRAAPRDAIRAWLHSHQHRLDLYRKTLAELHRASEVDLAMLAVAVEALRTLLYATKGGNGAA
jgi:glutamate dehydrogenase